MRRAEANRGFEIIAHPHTEIGEPAFTCEFLQQRKMKRGLFVSRGDAHEADHGKREPIAALADESDCVFRRDAGLLCFLAGVHFHEELKLFSGSLDFPIERLGELQPVKRVDGIEQRQRFADLVGLQRPDKVQLHSGKSGAQIGPFEFGFLDAILAKHTVTGLQYRENALLPVALAHGDKTRLPGRCDRRLPRGRYTAENSLEIRGRINGYGEVFGGQIMASALARAKLARAARALNARFPRLPPLILMTDARRLSDPLEAARGLPKGAAIILRHSDALARVKLAKSLNRIAGERGLLLLIAADAVLAARIGCAGLHLPEARAREAAHWKALHPSWLITAAAHSAHGVGIAARSRCDAVLLAPAFATQSHVERAALGVSRFCFVAHASPVAVYALGGVNEKTVRRLAGARLAGVAAIEALIPHNS